MIDIECPYCFHENRVSTSTHEQGVYYEYECKGCGDLFDFSYSVLQHVRKLEQEK